MAKAVYWDIHVLALIGMEESLGSILGRQAGRIGVSQGRRFG